MNSNRKRQSLMFDEHEDRAVPEYPTVHGLVRVDSVFGELHSEPSRA